MERSKGSGTEIPNADRRSKIKHQRLNSSDVGECGNDSSSYPQPKDKINRSRKYAMACAFFASLNAVLLGYGTSMCYPAVASLSVGNFLRN